MPATLPIGTVVESGDIAELNAQRFNRHTCWCGQSGSGKTYALGVLLEDAADAVDSLATEGLTAAQQRFHGRSR